MKTRFTFGIIALFTCGVFSSNTFAQEAIDSIQLQFAQEINLQDVKKHIFTLASDEFEGRRTGTKGQKKAANYIREYFKSIGLESPKKAQKTPYFQPFNLNKEKWSGCYIKTPTKKLEAYKDFAFYRFSPVNEEKTLDLVFLGDGSEKELESLDLKGKSCLLLIDSLESPQLESIIKVVKEKEADHIVLTFKTNNGELNNFMDRYRNWIMKHESFSFPSTEKETARFGSLLIDYSTALDLLQISDKKLKKLQKKNLKSKKNLYTKINAKLTIKLKKNKELVGTENVVGFIEGTDKKEELLILSAHYDHIGIHEQKVFNGADDNASGTTGLLEIAQAFQKAKEAGNGSRRSVLFLLLTAEEVGLMGSEYYVQKPLYPLENTIADLNVDMIGRKDKIYKEDGNYIYVIGADKLSQELHDINEKANSSYANLKLDYRYNDEKDPNRYYYRSDHYNFAKNNIPVIFYFNGTHADYHEHTDTSDKIDLEKVVNISRLVFHTAWELANREDRPALNEKVTQ